MIYYDLSLEVILRLGNPGDCCSYIRPPCFYVNVIMDLGGEGD